MAGTSKPHLNTVGPESGDSVPLLRGEGFAVSGSVEPAEGVGDRPPVLYEMSEGTFPQSLPDCPGHCVMTSYSSGVAVCAQAMALCVVLSEELGS